MQLYTPGLGPIPGALQNIGLTLQPGQGPSTVLDDPDNGGFNVQVSTVQVNPDGNTGVGQATIKAGPDTVTFDNSGNITVNGSVVGNIDAAGLVGPIVLPGGAIVSTSNQIDGPGGVTAERFTIINDEYKVTAALRKPTGATPYLDMNFEERTSTAADNATGRDETVPGVTGTNGQSVALGIDDLLRIEPDNALLKKLQGG